MMDRGEFLRLKNGLQTVANSNYQELLGFLQRFYAINVVREIGSRDVELKGEVNSLVKDAMEELFSSESANKYINGLVDINDDKVRMRVTTLALMDGLFPEFLDGSFNSNAVKSEEREIATMVITSTKAFQSRTPEFKNALEKAMSRPIDRSGYTEARITSELNELIGEDNKLFQR